MLRCDKDIATGVIKGDEKGCFHMASGSAFSKAEAAAHDVTRELCVCVCEMNK